MNDVFAITYPLSLITLLFGFIIGIGITIVVFGSLSFIVIIVLLCIGSIQIMPIIEIFNKILLKIFPDKLNLLEINLRKSFPIYYSNNFEHNKKYIYCFHPHGLFTLSHYLHIGTKFTDWKDKNIKGTALNILWWLPFGKEITEKYNFVKSNYDDMKNVLNNNQSLSVTLGGVKEMPLSRDNKITLNIYKKRGIFKMALETGTPLVPVIVYGENEIYKISENCVLSYINNLVLKYNLYFPIPKIESCIKWLTLFNKPLDNPVKTYVGKHIIVKKIDNPSDEDINKLREEYFEGLKRLYKNTRPMNYDKELYIV